MIPFGSQRGSGADLAVHLGNAEDNEFVELHDLRGAIADDLPGAFSEWEAQARAMTRADKYLYSLSINPDPATGRLTREQYEDYIHRVENGLGLAGQPRATVFHIKATSSGDLREHCHVVWSRIDVQECKAIHIAFDQRKLMAITRQFAYDHQLALPEGYLTEQARNRQLSLYEKADLDRTGLARGDRQEIITRAWKSADNAESFVAALEENGFVLAQGRRPYLVVDPHGHVSSLPRLINDRSVRSGHVEAFLGDSFPSGKLPRVENAQAMQERYLTLLSGMKKCEELAAQRDAMRIRQQERRLELKAQIEACKASHSRQIAQLERSNLAADERLAAAYDEDTLNVLFNRDARAPRGVVRLFSRLSGFAFVRRKLEEREDQKRASALDRERQALNQQHGQQLASVRQQHQMELMDFTRRERHLENVFKRELKTIETREEQRENQRRRALAQIRRRARQMPAVPQLTLGPSGRRADIAGAVRRKKRPRQDGHSGPHERRKTRPVQRDASLTDTFAAAAKPSSARSCLIARQEEDKARFPVQEQAEIGSQDDHEPEI